MNWDRPVHSFNYPNGEPQTPTRTPRFTSFGDSAFQTPKLESSFYDPRVTWDTSDPYASSPELFKTPQRFGLSTPSNQLKAQSGFSERETNRDFGSTSEHIAPGSERARASEGTGTARRLRLSSKPDIWGNEEGPGTVESAKSAASMQTPPPTSTSRRKGTEYDNNGTAQAFQNSSRKLSTVSMGGSHLETPSRLIGASPQLFSNIQGSPDLFQFASIDQSASPFFPQHKLFWDQESENQGENIGLPGSSNDIFGPTTGAAFGPSNTVSHDQQIPQLPTIQGSLDLPEFGDTSFGLRGSTTADAALFPAPFSTSPRVPVTKAEDPAMFLSSPARRFGHLQTRVDPRSVQRESQRQPYHHQTEESKREELHRSRSLRMPGSFSDEEDDDWTPRGIRPGLTRSLTHTAVSSHNRQQNQMSSGVLASTTGIRKTPSKGRTSPVKSLRQSLPRANSATLPTRSQSLVLKIGKDGRAKTEMQVVDESSTGLTDPLSGMDLDGSATESECESAEYPISHSLFSDSKSKLSRASSTSRPHSKGSSYSSATVSHSGRQSPWANSSRGLRRAPRPSLEDWAAQTPRRLSMPVNADFSRGTSATSDSLPDQNEDDGDAQHALRQVLKGRNRSRNSVVGYPSGLTRTSNTIAHLRSSPPHFGARLDLNIADSGNSPTTVTDPDIATPSTDRQSNPSNSTRCICNSMDNGGHLMIQCESCNHWLHTKCVGLERANLPPVYICVYCSQTPMRGGRLRDPLAGTAHAPTSPLAHKSFRYR
ncbi:hypothetical protein DTO212C5_3962 [Paecilomyces variotii]|nr:hypothetical protein DTO212C5_3962 [Paecilomyces variotii]